MSVSKKTLKNFLDTFGAIGYPSSHAQALLTCGGCFRASSGVGPKKFPMGSIEKGNSFHCFSMWGLPPAVLCGALTDIQLPKGGNSPLEGSGG